VTGKPINRAARRRAAKLGMPTAKELTELGADECSLCNKPFEHGEATVIGRVEDKLHQMGPCCSDRLNRCGGGSIYFKNGSDRSGSFTFTAQGVEHAPTAETGDREWFAAHPDRTHPLRTAVGGEPAGSWVTVRQFAPGYRQRLFFYPQPALVPLPDEEGLAHALFDQVQEAYSKGQDFIPIDATIRRYYAMDQGERA
jgi:hypothetical protein